MTELETMERAKAYIDKLANGIDPLTDEVIKDDSVLNNVRISRCLFYVSGVLQKVIDNGGEVRKVYSNEPQLPFSITPEQKAMIPLNETPVGITDFSKAIKSVLPEDVKSLAPTQITAWLMANDYLIEETLNNKKRKISTPKGESVGIITVDGISKTGIPYRKNIYTIEAQRFIIENLEHIADGIIEL